MPADEMAATLDAIGRTHMPFGRFGPARFPPDGIPITDLPFEYLEYFARSGFPRGRLGVLLEFVYHAKLNGIDDIFDAFRARRGGRASLRARREIPRLREADTEEATEEAKGGDGDA